MRLRSPVPISGFAFLASLAFAPSARAVVVQGFDATALGSASVASAVTASSPPRRLVNSGIGSSGLDGADLALYRSSGVRLTFDGPPSPEPIARRDIGLYVSGVFPGDKVPIIKGTALRTPTGSTRQIHCSEALEISVEVWSLGSLVRCAQVPISTVVTLKGPPDVTGPGGTVLLYGARTGKSGATSGKRCIVDETLPAPCDITVDGVTVTGDRLVFDVEGDGLPNQFDGAEMRFATAIGAVINGNVVIGGLTLIKDKPQVTLGLSRDPVGATLGDDMVYVEEPELGAISYRLVGSGGVRQMGVGPPNGHDPLHRPAYSHSWRLDTRPPGSPLTVAMDVACDDGSGLPPQTFTITGAIPTPATQIAFASTIPGDELTVQAIRDGLPVGPPIAAAPGSHVEFSAEPTGFTVSGNSSSSSIEIDFPAGTTFEMNGQVLVGNMLHMHSVSTHSRRVSDVHIVHPPSSPPGTWRLTDVSGSSTPPAPETGGRGVSARGPRQTISLDGTYAGHNRRLGVRDCCDVFEGQLEVALNGAPSIAIEPQPDPGEPEPELSGLDLYDCATDACEPSRSLEITRAGGTIQVGAVFTDGTSAQFVEADRKMIPITLTEALGGQRLVLTPAGAIEPRVILKSYRWLSPHSECFTIEFSEPVQFASALGTHVATKITFWTDPTGGASGTPTQAPVAAMTRKQLPPGIPWTAWSIAPPKVHTSGGETLRDAMPVTRGGQPVVSTWGTAYGGVEVAGAPDGTLTLQRDSKHEFVVGNDPPVFEAASTNEACPGFVVEMSAALPLVWSPRSNVTLYGSGRKASQPSDITTLTGLTIEYGGGPDAILRYVPAAAGTDPVVQLFDGATEVGSAPASEVTVSSTPGMVVMNDCDDDDVADIEARSFPPGTTATLPGHPPVGIDRIVLEPGTSNGAVLGYTTLTVDLEGLPPGIPVIGTRISQIMAPNANVDVPPATPPIAGLELRGVTPNPARGASTVRLALERDSRIRVQVLDIAGREVARLADGVRFAGEQTFTWSGVTNRGSKAAAGLYLVRVSGDGLITRTTRMIRLD